jgi:hypothetical protein
LKSLDAIKRELALEKNYAILSARLVYAGPLRLDAEEAKEDLIAYRPMWEIVFHTAPGQCECCHTAAVYVDAISGDYVGHVGP